MTRPATHVGGLELARLCLGRGLRVGAVSLVFAALLLAACSDNPYVIGQLRDAAAQAGSDAAVDGGRDPCAAALVCSSFETPDLRDEWSDVHIENTGVVEHTTARAHTGDGSLRAQTRGVSSVGDVVAQFAPVASGMLYLRAYVYVAEGLPTQTINLFFIGSRPDPSGDEPFVGLDVNLLDGSLQLFSPQAKPPRQTGESKIPRGRWFCFRAEVELSRAGTATLWVDDALALRATGVDSVSQGGVTMLRAGIDWSSDQSAFFEVFLDDLALSTSPLTCLM